MRDPYETLGVSRTANADEIKSAYRKLAKKYHPDLGGDPEKFKEINEAHDILSDPNKKAHFDNGGFRQQFDPRANAYRAGTHFHFEDIFNNEDFMNIFAQAAGFPGGRRKPKNSNVRIRMAVTLESILQEQTKNIDINTGNGNKQVEIKIPAGIHDGAVITYRGMGQNTYPDQPAGDLMVEVNILSNERFTRMNEDLHSSITIDCFKATLGTSIEFVTIREKRVKVTIPAGCQSGTVLRLPGEGLPSMNRSKFVGSQYLRVNISIPTNLTNEQIELVKQLVNIQNELNI
jgi:DnaJ-class molecular chaperone